MERAVTARYEGEREDDFVYLKIDVREMPPGVYELMVTVKDVRRGEAFIFFAAPTVRVATARASPAIEGPVRRRWARQAGALLFVTFSWTKMVPPLRIIQAKVAVLSPSLKACGGVLPFKCIPSQNRRSISIRILLSSPKRPAACRVAAADPLRSQFVDPT